MKNEKLDLFDITAREVREEKKKLLKKAISEEGTISRNGLTEAFDSLGIRYRFLQNLGIDYVIEYQKQFYKVLTSWGISGKFKIVKISQSEAKELLLEG